MSERKIGVYVCQCGGNISDYVDVEKVREAVSGDPDVTVTRTAMFTCSDATQQEIIDDIKAQDLDGLVVASCSPKLHTFTFRGVAKRAGLNPYRYTQVNIREQDSWAHTDDHEAATEKAIRLVKAGIARTRLLEPLDPTVVETVPKALVVGAGVAGLRAAIGLADIGLGVVVIEKEAEVGGWVKEFGPMFPHERDGRGLIEELLGEARRRENIVIFTSAELVRKGGSFGNYEVDIRTRGASNMTRRLEVGSIIVATGVDSYQPAEGEYGYGIEGVVTLPEFKRMVDSATGPLTHLGRPVRDVAYIYCVGSRQGEAGPNQYCSRFCCTSAVHTSLELQGKDPTAHQYHLYRDMRTYGRYELLYDESREKGAVYLKFPADRPPEVTRAPGGKLEVAVQDQLTSQEELRLPVDLVVLVTGMVPRQNSELVARLKLPIGRDGFFNEIHPKLRPVETVVDGVAICGACQFPKTASESVTSGLAAVAWSAAMLKQGRAELDPQVATVDPELCTWCGACADTCPYAAIGQLDLGGGRLVATIDASTCKGCGGCVPICPQHAISVLGYTGREVEAMIDSLAAEVA
ncbi:MAG: FAD-dependent oxidoreductase [Candidatus Dormiibacterota bacterium]